MTTEGSAFDVGTRAACDADLGELLELAQDFYREDGFATSRAELQVNLRRLVESEAAHVTVADETGRAVGFAITTTTFGLENGLIAELEDLYVRPQSRRRGVARRLVNEAAGWAREAGASQLEIVIAPNGQDVAYLDAFYQRLGLVDEGRRLRSLRLR